MSACFTLVQPHAAHMIVDAAVYLAPDLVLTSVNTTKATALVTLNAVMSCTGEDIVQRLLCELIEREFDTLDDLISPVGADWMDTQFRMIAAERLDDNAQVSATVIGWPEAAKAPGAWGIDVWTDGERHSDWLANSPWIDPGSLKVEWVDLAPNIVGSPMPEVSRFEERAFAVRASADYDPEIDLVHIIEMARLTPMDGRYGVGGKAVLSTVDQLGIHQRVVRHWVSDTVGGAIEPEPVHDWPAFRANLERGRSGRNPASQPLSRLQRERLEKKARKGTLRAV